jgi:hypothetical protein
MFASSMRLRIYLMSEIYEKYVTKHCEFSVKLVLKIQNMFIILTFFTKNTLAFLSKPNYQILITKSNIQKYTDPEKCKGIQSTY